MVTEKEVADLAKKHLTYVAASLRDALDSKYESRDRTRFEVGSRWDNLKLLAQIAGNNKIIAKYEPQVAASLRDSLGLHR